MPSSNTPSRNLMIHVFGDASDGLSSALRVARNSSRELGPDTAIHLVVQGPLVRNLVIDSTFGSDIAEAHATGLIEIAACRNSMDSAGVDATALRPEVEVVPSAAAYLAERQWQGWAYVRV